MPDHNDLTRKLTEAGLGFVAERITKMARLCYRIERTLTPEEQIPAGASKFGGSPDLPAGFVWPAISVTKQPEPFEFIGQVRLTDLPGPLPEPAPRDGLLSFFRRWGEGCVFYHPEGTSRQRTAAPPPADSAPVSLLGRILSPLKGNPEPRHTYRSCRLKAIPDLSLPDGGSSIMGEMKLGEADLEAYFEMDAGTPASARQPSDTTQHQMFGYSSPVQSEMELECEAIRRGEKMRWDAPPERFIAAMRDWVLLLQVDTDDYKEGPGWMWGDAGILYFWIHRDDLAVSAFDKVVAMEQCH